MADFAEPPSDAPPMDATPAPETAEESGFTFLGDAPPAEGDAPAFVGDVNEAPDAFAAPPADDFASPPAEDYEAFAAPPAEDTPIVLAPPVEDVPVEDAAPAEPTLPSAMQKWNADWLETLAARKDEENAKKAEMIEAARLVKEKFQKDREAKREAKMSRNREDEQAKLEAIEADLENDNSWQKVCKMVELSHDGVDNSEDVKRMRDCLILLKNEPSRAAAVGA